MSTSIVQNRDCLEAMKEFPDKFWDLAICDPPYGDGSQTVNVEREREREREQYWNRFGGRFDKYKGIENRGKVGEEVRKKIISWDYAPNEEYFKELFRVSKNQIIWGGNYFSLPPTRCFLIWEKTNVPENFTMAMAEYAWCSIQGNAKIFKYSAVGQEGRFHPTQKPIELYQWILSKYAKQGDKILDTHLGSGSSRIACYNGGYDFWGYEIDKEYFEKQEQRFENHTSQLRMEF